MKEQTNQVVWITGASSGIGEALALEFAQRGSRLGLLARREEVLQQIADSLRSQGTKVLTLAADVTHEEELQQAATQLHQHFGRLDVVVANAGVGYNLPARKMGLDKIQTTFQVNVLGLANTFQAALPLLLEQGSGQLVGVSSLAALRGIPGSAAYSASKAAVAVYLEGLRADLRRQNIHVTTVFPGFVRTPMTDKNPFPMPLIWDASKAARFIVNGIEKKRRIISFPWPISVVMHLLSALPAPLFDLIAANIAKTMDRPPRRQRTKSL